MPPPQLKSIMPNIVSILIVFLVLFPGAELDGQEPVQSSSDAEESITQLKSGVCTHLERLLKFKDKKDFKEFGFGKGGKYNKWLTDVEALRDSQPKGFNHPIPLILRAAPGDLMMLGLEYMQKKGETDYTRQMLPELKQTIGYFEYLAEKKSRAAKMALKKTRTWKDSTGKFSVKAKFVEIADGKAVLEKEGGTRINIPLEKLSNNDLSLIKTALGKIPRTD